MDGSAVFVFDKTGKKILLVKRRDVPVWVIPSGGIEPNETPEQGAIRESKEESGFDIKITREVAEYSHKGDGKKSHVFEAKVIGGKSQINSEAKEIAFFGLNKLPELRHPSISDWLLDLQKNSKKVIKKEIEGVSIRQAVSHIHKHPLLVLRFLLTKVGVRINT